MMGVSLGLGAVLAVTLIIVVSLITGNSVGDNALDGNKIGSVSLPSLTTSVTVHGPWQSGHPTVVVFFASWCGPCVKELPRIAHFEQTHHLGRVRFLGIDYVDLEGKARQFAHRSGVTFPVGFDSSGSVTEGQFLISNMPDTVFINAKGVVVNVVNGPISNATLAADIRALN